MNYTSFTALIITLHDLSVISSLIVAVIITGMVFVLFIRKRTRRWLITMAFFLCTFLATTFLAEDIFQRQPIGFEIVQAG